MSDLFILLVELFRHYNVLFLAGLILLQNNGIPVGANFLVIVSGAFAYGGEFNIALLLGQVWFFAFLGDSLSYWLWRKGGAYLKSRYPRLGSRIDAGVNKADAYFDKYGRITVFFTRFPLSALGPLVNISAGTSKFDYKVFLVYAFMGEFLWVSFNLGIGYWFGDSVEQIASLVNQMGVLTLLIVALIVMGYLSRQLYKSKRVSS